MSLTLNIINFLFMFFFFISNILFKKKHFII